MQRQSGVTSIVVIILISALSIIGAYYFGFQKGSEKTEIITQSPEFTKPSAPPIEKVDEEKLKDDASVKPLAKIPILSTEGWQLVSLNGVEFKIPPGVKFEKSDSYWGNDPSGEHALLYFSEYSPSWVSVTDYKGGSRREQFLGPDPFDCHFIFEEAMFGSVKALQIAGDGGWCQGGSGGIVVVVGNKFFKIYNLSYDLQTKEIYRFDKRDTIISTLKKTE